MKYPTMQELGKGDDGRTRHSRSTSTEYDETSPRSNTHSASKRDARTAMMKKQVPSLDLQTQVPEQLRKKADGNASPLTSPDSNGKRPRPEKKGLSSAAMHPTARGSDVDLRRPPLLPPSYHPTSPLPPHLRSLCSLSLTLSHVPFSHGHLLSLTSSLPRSIFPLNSFSPPRRPSLHEEAVPSPNVVHVRREVHLGPRKGRLRVSRHVLHPLASFPH